MKINVTQKHIDDARAGILYLTDEKSCCPIALAVYEQLYGMTYSLADRGFKEPKKCIRFGEKNYGNPCHVLDNIELSAFSLPHLYGRGHPPIHVDMNHNTKMFIVNFDKGHKVEPFEFELNLPRY